MTRRTARARAGITLTEILISILIMGVGLVSLATLFPLGLMRLRGAAMKSRSAVLSQSAGADVSMRNLFAKGSFAYPYSPWYFARLKDLSGPPTNTEPYDPWIQDIPYGVTGHWAEGVYAGKGGDGVLRTMLNFSGVERPGPGLPVAYDPLWRYTTGIYLNPTTGGEARFASGAGLLRYDPDGDAASAFGLQRITNFYPPRTPDATVPNIFVSPDDVIFQSSEGATGAAGSASPIVPDMSGGATVNEWLYTWMFTGRRVDASEDTSYEGDIVVFHGRPLAVDGARAAGEDVVEAVFGYSKKVISGTNGKVGYGAGADRSVLLRWPATTPDPDVRVGGWIADVTYELLAARNDARTKDARDEGIPSYPYQRCYWYQVAKKSPAQDAVAFSGDDGAYRSMVVTVNTPLRAKTLMNATSGQPAHVNAALVSRYVVNVFPKTFKVR